MTPEFVKKTVIMDLIPITSCIENVRQVRSRLAFASNAEGWVFESRPRQNLIIKIGSDNSTAKLSATDVSVNGSWGGPL